jgi:glyoxylase-like metal-dependent hydrolase (beta-lactamase superfamily II)/ferredoxin
MARPARRLAANAPGPFYVDASCIDCGTCWRWDPAHFAPGGGQARVVQQPEGEPAMVRALLAQQACPVAAIGSPAELLRRHSAVLAHQGFPALLLSHPEAEVHECGWASRQSFGACSYLLVRPPGAGGNVLIDSPRFNAPLARRIAALGGLAAIVLTHRDDVADQARWASHFSCPRWIHRADANAAPGAEHLVDGRAALQGPSGLVLVPTPGHTQGSMVAVLGAAGSEEGQVLFSGDHLWWSERLQQVVASRRYCWWNWPEQVRSVEALLPLDVRWLLPGHGGRRAFAAGDWAPALRTTLEGCQAGTPGEGLW